jgi:hypothetical protein
MTTLPLPTPESNPSEKRCSKCKRMWPATPEYFCRDKKTKDGLHAGCKQCKSEYNASRSEEDRKSHKAWLEAHKEEQKQYNKHYYAEHREKKILSHRQWREEHCEEIKAYELQYRSEHHEELLLGYKRYNAVHREERARKSKLYRSTEHGKLLRRTVENNRRARKKAIPGILTEEQILHKLKLQRYRCYYAACGHSKFEKAKGKYVFHLEHTIPVSRAEEGPRHDIDYVVLACPSCNLRKHDRLPHEFFEGGRLF